MNQGDPPDFEDFGRPGRRLLCQFEEAKTWCEARGWDPETALKSVDEACCEYEALKAEFVRCDQLLIDTRLNDQIEIVGCARDPQTGVLNEMPHEIVREYFMLPVHHDVQRQRLWNRLR
jgi:hypothetical protein